MNVVVSACLLGENCKYNGGNNRDDRLVGAFSARACRVVPVCPEVLGGLTTPRVPAEIVGSRVVNAKGVSVDEEYRRGAEEALRIALHVGADCAVLQPRSPSCGVHAVYDGTFSGKLVAGAGVFASLLHQAGIPAMEPDDFLEYLERDE